MEHFGWYFFFKYFLDVPIEGCVIQETVHRDVLLQEAVSQDGHRGEADVVHRQIGCIIQGLGRAGGKGKIMVRRRRGL